ncbi:fasciclin domain-containing protein [Antarcticibacterium sp. 1MA-6-2]|uniref:fasciclin domain-containing protein n=1 Tax=Antarcticibacterium sp. 1MA-6-2 TaxID=2908210 RepID=UPI001F417FAC|nr:fasciclin domain-containing protein [Antarcticibacterium sp. 1MA-6-2]UJH91111.1 fasciclin domain-containing protein [Antarcticibacterium sp. 1MA-6-2]
MKLKNLLMLGVLSLFAFSSCKNDASEGENEDIELVDSEREADLRMNEQRLENERNSVTARIQENQELSTFSQNMNRNQVTTSLRQDESVSTTGNSPTSTTTEAQKAAQNQENNPDPATGVRERATGNQSGTMEQTQGMVTYTIFAPSNSAYEKLPEADRNQINSNTEDNRNVNVASINYLMVEERLTEEDLKQQIQSSNGSYAIKTMQGEEITATLEGDQIVLKDGSGNQARITQTDSTASDGVVHVIDAVLKPKDPTKNAAAERMTKNSNTTSGSGTGQGTGTGS